jgi:hypothetical protein
LREYVLTRRDFPVPAFREFRLPSREGGRIALVSAWRKPEIREISLYFPDKSGICAKRRVRYRLHAPPFSLGLQRLSAFIQEQIVKFALFLFTPE